jgi:hypothetical protein
MSSKKNMNKVLDQLMNSSYCLCCGDLLDGRIWNKGDLLVSKPTYMQMEFCYFPCENEYNKPFGYSRKIYSRKTKV